MACGLRSDGKVFDFPQKHHLNFFYPNHVPKRGERSIYEHHEPYWEHGTIKVPTQTGEYSWVGYLIIWKNSGHIELCTVTLLEHHYGCASYSVESGFLITRLTPMTTKSQWLHLGKMKLELDSIAIAMTNWSLFGAIVLGPEMSSRPKSILTTTTLKTALIWLLSK